MIIVLIGVSGSGKTTIGRLLASRLGWPFYDGDDLHPAANVEKMHRGLPLTDSDRAPWLDSIRALIDRIRGEGRSAIIACSALKQTYRDRLAGDLLMVRFVYLRGTYDLISERLAQRIGHFMPAGLLRSQFDTLEEPHDAVRVDVGRSPEDIALAVERALGVGEQGRG